MPAISYLQLDRPDQQTDERQDQDSSVNLGRIVNQSGLKVLKSHFSQVTMARGIPFKLTSFIHCCKIIIILKKLSLSLPCKNLILQYIYQSVHQGILRPSTALKWRKGAFIHNLSSKKGQNQGKNQDKQQRDVHYKL